MDKTALGLLAAMSAVAPLAGAHAEAVTSEEAHRALQVASISELLETPGNAVAILNTLNAEKAQADSEGVQLAQFYYHHHHHHHHHFYYHHHHHHHHHHHYYYHHHHHYHRPCFYSPLGYVCP